MEQYPHVAYRGGATTYQLARNDKTPRVQFKKGAPCEVLETWC